MSKRILITGKNGQLGQSLQKQVIQNSKFKIQNSLTFVGRDQLDLSDPAAIDAFFADQQFDVIINCAAYTAVDKAESEPELADQINHQAVKHLAHIAKALDAVLIHVSTDYVFDGTQHRPYIETDPTVPNSVYGTTKHKGEQAIQAINPKGCIIRTSWVYSEYGNNFVKTMLRLGQERDHLNVIFDQIGTPTYATDLANAIVTMLNSEFLMMNEETDQPIQNSTFKIYHYSNEGVCSWYDFAKTIFELSDIECEVSPIETKDYPTPAKRPHYSLMNKAKIKQTFNLTIPYWKDSLGQCLMNISKFWMMQGENIVLDKSFKFSVRVVKLYQHLCKEQKEYVLSKQLLRAGTSIGANINEAQAAQSTKDFIAKLSIASKEAREVQYWLQLLCEIGYLDESQKYV